MATELSHCLCSILWCSGLLTCAAIVVQGTWTTVQYNFSVSCFVCTIPLSGPCWVWWGEVVTPSQPGFWHKPHPLQPYLQISLCTVNKLHLKEVVPYSYTSSRLDLSTDLALSYMKRLRTPSLYSPALAYKAVDRPPWEPRTTCSLIAWPPPAPSQLLRKIWPLLTGSYCGLETSGIDSTREARESCLETSKVPRTTSSTWTKNTLLALTSLCPIFQRRHHPRGIHPGSRVRDCRLTMRNL